MSDAPKNVANDVAPLAGRWRRRCCAGGRWC